MLDFGLVKARTAVGQLELTGANTLTLGTLLYMSPECLWNIHDKVDARADVYSLGAVGYYLLTGQSRLFDCATLGELLLPSEG